MDHGPHTEAQLADRLVITGTAGKSPARRIGWKFRARAIIANALLLPALLLTLFAKPVISEHSWLRIVLFSAAWIFFVGGTFFRFWATLYLGGRKRHVLMEQGPYSISRNPLYFGSMLNAVATALFLESITFAVFVGAVVLAYFLLVIPAEENDLRGLHGRAYDAYWAKVPAMLPRLSLYVAAPTIEVNLKGLARELKRALRWLLIPILGAVTCHLRYCDWWPHLFPMP